MSRGGVSCGMAFAGVRAIGVGEAGDEVAAVALPGATIADCWIGGLTRASNLIDEAPVATGADGGPVFGFAGAADDLAGALVGCLDKVWVPGPPGEGAIVGAGAVFCAGGVEPARGSGDIACPAGTSVTTAAGDFDVPCLRSSAGG